MSDSFINQPIEPIGLAAPVSGLPSTPAGFKWRGRDYKIEFVQEASKDLKPDRTHGSSEKYINKLWFHCRLDTGQTAAIYYERNSRGGSHRWFIYSLTD